MPLALLTLPVSVRTLTLELSHLYGGIVCFKGGSVIEIFDKKILERGYEQTDECTVWVNNSPGDEDPEGRTKYQFPTIEILKELIGKKEEYKDVSSTLIKEDHEKSDKDVDENRSTSSCDPDDVLSDGWESNSEKSSEELELEDIRRQFPNISFGKTEI